MFRHVLVPIDGSELSKAAITHAICFAKDVSGHITFLFVMKDYEVSMLHSEEDDESYDPIAPNDFTDAMRTHADRILQSARAEADAAGVKVDCLAVTNKEPHKAIIDVGLSKKADVIFMASHSRRGLANLLLGSVTQKVLSNSKIPVLVYR
ncbi:MAG: universal stress protein [Gammaproteobacteria bacterium]|jgi:nucleotide-binding universal stress UspA family protein|nr:universal stress protein [Gammaproteobacteria bacterium]MBU0770170.1 universal stress protein [Gammaproteobacteria bacterium]MBU0855222.1 universal stress protein [Gammaproteobacteria bacterium]MBU1847412.1 universal stress protein [Gammaproteobacteria bacterium]